MAKNLDVVTIGSIIKETIVYPDKQIGPVIGSPAAYSSLVMAAQGCKVGIVTYYGYDMENMISELDALDRTGFIPFAYTTTNNLVYRQDGTKYVEYTRKTPDIRFEDISDQYLEADFFKICPMQRLRAGCRILCAHLGPDTPAGTILTGKEASQVGALSQRGVSGGAVYSRKRA